MLKLAGKSFCSLLTNANKSQRRYKYNNAIPS
jgi:hypothetical protein